MMAAGLNSNRSMFWRILRRLLLAHRGRLFVVLLGLGAGAAVTAALLNLQVDAKRRLTTEFRAFGFNVIIVPSGGQSNPFFGATLDEALLGQIPLSTPAGRVNGTAFLYLIANAESRGEKPAPVVVAGTHFLDGDNPPPAQTGDSQALDSRLCFAGAKLAQLVNLRAGDQLTLRSPGHEEPCRIARVDSTGGPDDNQIFPALDVAERLAGLDHRISIVRLSVPGTPRQINDYVAGLRQRFPDVEVHPMTQFTEAQARIYNRISGLLNFTVGIVLVLTALCVMAAMTNVAMERRNDVGLMKAIGGAKRRVLRLFLTEATILGLAGGILGAAAGIGLSIWLGKAVFGLAARPRLIVYPVSVLLTMIVAILSAFPLRRLANVRPASVFRGEA
jgi:putative ABC transport system permease protein